MKQHEINQKIIRLIGEYMNQWNMQMSARGTRIASIPIKSEIYQGDALLPSTSL